MRIICWQTMTSRGRLCCLLVAWLRLRAVSSWTALFGSGSLSTYPGFQVNVTFRGTVFTCIIEGVSMTATPESSRYTFYLSGADLNAYLILDNTVFGTLDNNKLGY
jgi:hypothetical protein